MENNFFEQDNTLKNNNIVLSGKSQFEQNFFPEYKSAFEESHNKSTSVEISHKQYCSPKVYEKEPTYIVSKKVYDNGSKILNDYKNTPVKPNQLLLFYEKKNPNKSNLFGTFSVVKTGADFNAMIGRMIDRTEKVDGRLENNKLKKLESDDDLYNYIIRDISDVVSKNDIKNAIQFDRGMTKKTKRFVFGLNYIEEGQLKIIQKIQDYLSEQILSEDRYQPVNKKTGKYNSQYNPLIPINDIIKYIKDTEKEDMKQSALSDMLDIIGYAKRLASVFGDSNPVCILLDIIIDSILYFDAIIKKIKNYAVEHLSDIEYFLRIINAVLCGLINGLISFIQLILWLNKIIVDLTYPDMVFDEKTRREDFLELHNIMEVVEDFIDVFREHWTKVKNGFSIILTQFDASALLTAFGEIATAIFGEANDFDIACFAGSAIFDVILGVVIALATGGASLIAQAGSKSQKLIQVAKLIFSELVSTATFGLSDLVTLTGALFKLFIQKCKTGFKGFLEFLKEVFGTVVQKADGAKQVVELKTIEIIASLRSTQIKLMEKWKISSETIKFFIDNKILLAEVNFDKLMGTFSHQPTMVSPNGYMISYKQYTLMMESEEMAKDFAKKIEGIKKEAGQDTEKALKKLDELAKWKVLNEHIKKYIKNRKALKALSKDAMLAKFKEAVQFVHFDGLKGFYDDMVAQYPKLKGALDENGIFRQTNFAHFKTQYFSNGKLKSVEEFAHSGEELLYDNFLHYGDDFEDMINRFKNGLSDVDNISRRNDSEAKYIYNFLKNHLNEADEFVIETKNIYFACNSCQRELLMLKDYVESLGKKMTIIVHGDEGIKGGDDFYELVINKQ